MTMEELEEHIDNILKATIARLKEAYDSRKEESVSKNFNMGNTGCRLVFPIKRDNQTRISEQELRFAFVEAFNEYCNEKELPYFYSIETPTRDPYSGFSTSEPKVKSDGKSGNIDLVIYDENGNRICLFEFKAHNADKKEYLKDFVKLDNPTENENGNTLRFFINIFKDANNLDNFKKSKIISSNLNKIKNADNYTYEENTNYKDTKKGMTTAICFTLVGNRYEII